MTVELMETISIVCYVAGLFFLILSEGLFFGLRIADVVAELSGRKARRGIETIRRQNPETGETAGSAQRPGTAVPRQLRETEVLRQPRDTAVPRQPRETEVLRQPRETEVLAQPRAAQEPGQEHFSVLFEIHFSETDEYID